MENKLRFTTLIYMTYKSNIALRHYSIMQNGVEYNG